MRNLKSKFPGCDFWLPPYRSLDPPSNCWTFHLTRPAAGILFCFCVRGEIVVYLTTLYEQHMVCMIYIIGCLCSTNMKRRKKWACLIPRHYPSIRMRGVSKITNILSQDMQCAVWDSNRRRPEYKAVFAVVSFHLVKITRIRIRS